MVIRERRLFAVSRNDSVLLLAQAKEPDQAIEIAATMLALETWATKDDRQAKHRRPGAVDLQARPATDREQSRFDRAAAPYQGELQLAAMFTNSRPA